MIYIAGICITFFLTFVLLTKKGKSNSDKILLPWLFIIMVHLSLFAMISQEVFLEFPYFLGIEIPLPLLHGPFLFLYTLSLTRGSVFTPKVVVHFVPYGLALLSTMPFILLDGDTKIDVYQHDGKGYNTLSTLILIGIILSGIAYILASLKELSNYRQKLKDNFSQVEKINLNWLYRLIIGISFVWILVFFAPDTIIFYGVVLFVLLIGYYGVKQVGIFTSAESLRHFAEVVPSRTHIKNNGHSESTKYKASPLDSETLETLQKKLSLLMRDKKLFLTAELTLAMVAAEMEVHPNTLSQLINTMEQKRFFDYINQLRVDEFIARAKNPENQKYTLLSLAYACGFNSKTSFNRNFKNATGISPSEYLKKIKAS